MSTLDLLQTLKERCLETLIKAGQSVAEEHLSEAILYYEQAKEMLEQTREIAFRAGNAYLVRRANDLLSALLEDIDRLKRVQAIKSLPGQINSISTLPPREEMH